MATADTTTNSNVGFAPEVAPYASDMLGRAQALTDPSQNPYTVYTGDRVAQFSPLQNQSFDAAANMQPSAYTGQAAGAMTGFMNAAANTSYNPNSYGNTYSAPGAYQPNTNFGFNNVTSGADQLKQYQMGPADQVRTDKFTQPGIAQSYMSPYVQQVLDNQRREMFRTADIAQQQRNAQQIGRGAFGGSRTAIQDSEAGRNLTQQLGDMEAAGLQSAFTNAEQQFNADQARRLQADTSNQGANLSVGAKNLDALLGVQQLGSGQNMQAQLANQQARQAAQTAAEQSRQFGYGQQMTAAQMAAQYGLASNQLNENSQQYGAGLGLQGLQAAMTGANALGNMGAQDYTQRMGIANLQNQYGGQQRDAAQSILNNQYTDWQGQQNFDYKNLGLYADIVNKTPVSNLGSSVYEAPPDPLSAGIGAGVAVNGLLSNPTAKKDGGSIRGTRSSGLADLLLSQIN